MKVRSEWGRELGRIRTLRKFDSKSVILYEHAIVHAPKGIAIPLEGAVIEVRPAGVLRRLILTVGGAGVGFEAFLFGRDSDKIAELVNEARAQAERLGGATDPDARIISDLTLVESGGSRIPKRTVCVVACRADGVTVIPQGDAAPEHWDYSEVQQLEVDGLGAQRRNAGVIGGGFGLAGAAEGILAATVINAATTRTRIKTTVRVVASRAEYVFLSHAHDVEPLQTSLAPVFTRMRMAAQAAPSPAAVPSPKPLAGDQLRELGRLHDEGLVNDQEFQAKRAELISRM